MTDLSTRYLGLALRSPLIASSSPLTGDVETIRELEDAGAAAVVLPSLFEEQIELDTNEPDRELAIELVGVEFDLLLEERRQDDRCGACPLQCLDRGHIGGQRTR